MIDYVAHTPTHTHISRILSILFLLYRVICGLRVFECALLLHRGSQVVGGWATTIAGGQMRRACLNGTEPRQGSGTCFLVWRRRQLHFVLLFFLGLLHFAHLLIRCL